MATDIAPRTHRAEIRRDGSIETLRCGDCIVLASGDVVPADCRIVTCHNLRIDEAALTGDSEPADRRIGLLLLPGLLHALQLLAVADLPAALSAG